MELCRDICRVEMVVGYPVRRGGDLKVAVQTRKRCVVKHNLITEVYLMTM